MRRKLVGDAREGGFAADDISEPAVKIPKAPSTHCPGNPGRPRQTHRQTQTDTGKHRQTQTDAQAQTQTGPYGHRRAQARIDASPGTGTDRHRQAQAPADTHRHPQTPTDTHMRPQASSSDDSVCWGRRDASGIPVCICVVKNDPTQP